MKLIGQEKDKEVWFKETKKPYSFESPFNDKDYVCIIFNNDPKISNEDQNRLSELIVQSGCKNAVCAGHNCSTWDDSIDMAYICTDANFNPPENTFVMTTWHENQSVEDIVSYTLNCTNFGDHKFNKFLILFIGEQEPLKRKVLKEINKICKPNVSNLNSC